MTSKTTLQVMDTYKTEAVFRKDKALKDGLNAPIPHDLWRRIIPIAREFEAGNANIAAVYTYLLAHVNGQKTNDRYMAAFTSVAKIARDTRITVNRIAKLVAVLEAVGLLRTCYDYAGNKPTKLYYPLYSSNLSDEQIRENLSELYKETGKSLKGD